MNINNLRDGKFLPGVITPNGTVTVHPSYDAAVKAARKVGGAFFWFRLNQTMINDAVTPRLSAADTAELAARIAALPAAETPRTAEATIAAALEGAPEALQAAVAAIERPGFVNPRLTKADLLLRQIADLAAGKPEPAETPEK